MGYVSIRTALVNYFAPVPQMQTMYKEAPWIINGADFQLNPGTTAAAVGFIHIDHSMEERITIPAYTGTKGVDYTVALVFLYKYFRPFNAPSNTAPDAYVDGLDALIDTIKAKIRADQNGGAPANIFQMGTGSGGSYAGEGPDIEVTQDLPEDNEEGIFTLCRVQFHVYEIIQG